MSNKLSKNNQIREKFERLAHEKEERAIKKFARKYITGVECGTRRIIGDEKSFVRREPLKLVKAPDVVINLNDKKYNNKYKSRKLKSKHKKQVQLSSSLI